MHSKSLRAAKAHPLHEALPNHRVLVVEIRQAVQLAVSAQRTFQFNSEFGGRSGEGLMVQIRFKTSSDFLRSARTPHCTERMRRASLCAYTQASTLQEV